MDRVLERIYFMTVCLFIEVIDMAIHDASQIMSHVALKSRLGDTVVRGNGCDTQVSSNRGHPLLYALG